MSLSGERGASAIRRFAQQSPGQADTGPDAEATIETLAPSDNPALDDWRRSRD